MLAHIQREHNINIMFLSCLGLWPYQRKLVRSLLTTCYLATEMSFYPLEVLMLYDHWNSRMIFECCYQLALLTNFVMKQANNLWHRDKLRRLYETMDNHWNIFTSESEMRILKSHSALSRKFTIFYSTFMYSMLTVFLMIPLTPIFLDIVRPLNETRPRVFIVTIELRLDQEKYYVPILIYNIIIIIFGAIAIISTDTMYVVCIAHACGLFSIISQQLEEIISKLNVNKEISKHECCTVYESSSEQVIYQEYIVCLKKYQLALEFVDVLNSIYKTIMLILLLLNGATISLVGIRLIRIIAKAMNFKTDYYLPDNIANEKWGRAGENDSYTGLIGEAIAGNADFFLGDLYYTMHHLNYFDLSTSYNTECLTFLTPEALTDNSWKLLILPFTLNAWIALLCTLLVGGSICHLITLFYQKYIDSYTRGENATNDKTGAYDSMYGLYLYTDLPNSLLYIYGMLLQVSLPCLPNALSVRIFIGWWWLYSILVAVAYRASMTANLANPIARVTIDTLTQLTRTSIAIGGWNEESKEFFLASSDPDSQDIGGKFELTENEEEAIDRVAKGAFCYYENSYFLRNARGKVISEMDRRKNKSESVESTIKYNLHIMEECVIQMPIALGLEKNSPLKPHVDIWVTRMTEVGLVPKWLSDVMEWSKIMETQHEPEPEKALINLRKLYAAFVALAIGYFLSFVVLFGEILHWRYVVLRDPKYDKYHLDEYYKTENKFKT